MYGPQAPIAGLEILSIVLIPGVIPMDQTMILTFTSILQYLYVLVKPSLVSG